MKVVACIPLYNGESTIRQTIESLLNQSHPLYKIKVFNNASTDNSKKIIDDFALNYKEVEVFHFEENIGGEGNFTRCIEASEGDYTIVAHSDDIYEKDFILKSLEGIIKSQGAIASFTNAVEIDSNNNVTGHRFFPKELSNGAFSVFDLKEFYELVFSYANFVTCPSVLCRSDVYREKIQRWKGSEFKTSADLDVWFRILEHGKMVAINSKLIRYRVAMESYSFRIAKKRITRHDIFIALEYYHAKYKEWNSKMLEDGYHFLKIKDQALIIINKIRQKLPLNGEDNFKILFSDVLIGLLRSNWHRSFFLKILAIKLIYKVKKIND